MHPLSTFSNLESVGLLVGVGLSNVIVVRLIETGIWLLPVLAGVVTMYFKKHEYDQKWAFGNHVLAYLLITAAIIYACFIPMFEVDVKQIVMNEHCEEGTMRSVYHENDTTNDVQPATSDVPKMSLWWMLWYLFSGGFINQMIHDVPCYTDNHYINALLTSQTIGDPRLRAEYIYFRRSCYAPALSKYAQIGPRGDERKSLGYVGAEWFLDPNNPGYYHNCATISNDPLSSCHWNPHPGPSNGLTRWSSKRGQSEDTKDKGFPTCAEWWSGDGSDIGLQQMLFDEATDINRLKGIRKHVADANKDAVIKAMLNNVEKDVLETTGNVEAGFAVGFNLASGILNLRNKFDSLAQTLSQAYIIKKIMAFAQPMLLFALMLFFPIFFVIAGYKLAPLMTYTMVVVAIKAIPWIIVASNYATNSLGGMGIGFGGNIAGAISGGLIDRLIFEIIAMWTPVVLFLVLLVVLSWVGYGAGSFLENSLSGRGPESGIATPFSSGTTSKR